MAQVAAASEILKSPALKTGIIVAAVVGLLVFAGLGVGIFFMVKELKKPKECMSPVSGSNGSGSARKCAATEVPNTCDSTSGTGDSKSKSGRRPCYDATKCLRSSGSTAKGCKANETPDACWISGSWQKCDDYTIKAANKTKYDAAKTKTTSGVKKT